MNKRNNKSNKFYLIMHQSMHGAIAYMAADETTIFSKLKSIKERGGRVLQVEGKDHGYKLIKDVSIANAK